MSSDIERTILQLTDLFEQANIDGGHGIDHALVTMYHATQAANEFDLTPEQRLAVLLAALLHDADDGKFWYNSKNAEMALQPYPEDVRKMVLEMIALVSCSKNGNNAYNGPQWMLIPRYADRLEAMGFGGIQRAYVYTLYVNKPIHTDSTPKAYCAQDVMAHATAERFHGYLHGVISDSMVDHFYDKLLHLNIHTGIKYIDTVMQARHKLLVDFVMDYWQQNGAMDMKKYELYD